MKQQTFPCHWPITDPTRPVTTLIDEALESLDTYLDRRGFDRVGFPAFHRRGDELHAETTIKEKP